MTYAKCRHCHEWAYLPHGCPPEWHVWIGDHHDSADLNDCVKVRARDAETAATKACELWDDERSMLDSTGELCVVRPAVGGEAVVVHVEAESVVRYYGLPLPSEGV